MLRLGSLGLLLLPLLACGDSRDARRLRAAADSTRADSIARARQDSTNRTLPGYVVDSILPPEEAVARFRARLGGPPATAFHDASPDRDALVQRFFAALARPDTAALRAMTVSAREFIDLYYPSSPFAKGPLRQPPEIAWALISNPSEKGLARLLQRYAGHSVRVRGVRCDPRVAREGRITRFAGCLVDAIETGERAVTRRYFGSIVVLDGRYKFLSLSNQF